MKKILAVLSMAAVLSVANAGFAATPDGYQSIAKEDLNRYSRAALAQVKANWATLNVANHCNDSFAYSAISDATEASLRQDNGQPLLIFSSVFETNHMRRAILTTSADFITVTGIRIQYLEVGDINTGDLRDPKVSQDFLVQQDIDCTAK